MVAKSNRGKQRARIGGRRFYPARPEKNCPLASALRREKFWPQSEDSLAIGDVHAQFLYQPRRKKFETSTKENFGRSQGRITKNFRQKRIKIRLLAQAYCLNFGDFDFGIMLAVSFLFSVTGFGVVAENDFFLFPALLDNFC